MSKKIKAVVIITQLDCEIIAKVHLKEIVFHIKSNLTTKEQQLIHDAFMEKKELQITIKDEKGK
jgi:hypothetical protein